KLNLRQLSLQAMLPAKTEDLLSYLAKYEAWLDRDKTLREERFILPSFQRRQEELLDYLAKHLYVSELYDFSGLSAVLEAVAKIEQILKAKRSNAFIKKELNVIAELLAKPADSYLSFVRTRS